MQDTKKKKLTLSVTTVQTLETKATPYEFSSSWRGHQNTACPTGQVASVAYY